MNLLEFGIEAKMVKQKEEHSDNYTNNIFKKKLSGLIATLFWAQSEAHLLAF